MPRHKPAFPSSPLPPGGANALERFTPKVISRSMIKNAPYNPRQITPAARKLLRDNLERVGLVEPLVWNVQTGNLVSGHQRLEIMDGLIGSKEGEKGEFKLTVAQIDVDSSTEKTLNVHLNNAAAQGTFDVYKMGALLEDPEYSWVDSSWTSFSWELEFGFRPEVVRGLDGSQDAPDESEATSGDLEPVIDATPLEDSPTKSDPLSEPSLRNTAEAIKARKAEYEHSSSVDPENSVDYFLMVAFSSADEKDRFLSHNGFRQSLRYIGADELRPLLRDDACWS